MKIFNFENFVKNYEKFFSLHEIKNNILLVWIFGAMLFTFFNSFDHSIGVFQHSKTAVEMGDHLCWPHWQNCGDAAFLVGLPNGYSQSIWYMALFAVMIIVIHSIVLKRWVLAHFLMSLLWFWKLFLVGFLSMANTGNYDYYHLLFTFVLLFLPHKIFFLKFMLVWFYFLSTAVKIHEGWTLGTYFSSMSTGLPVFPDWSTPIWTNLVIGMEMLGAWALMWRSGIWQKIAFVFYVVFHLYSGILVHYFYPATVMPVLLILFGPWYQYTETPKGWSTLGGWMLVALLGFGQAVSHFIPGDEKMTLEGNYYGLYMFEANHQCISHIKVYKNGEEPFENTVMTQNARFRCAPYRYWFSIKKKYCEKSGVDRIEWALDHSINGHSFYRIVDEENACDLEYRPFRRNLWIKLPEEGAVKVGYPLPNYYY